jgi:CheY-like chemotaxis protein
MRGSAAKYEFHFALDLKPVYADPGQIAQVMSNMAINAVQSMPDGGELTITAENIELAEHGQIPLKAGFYVHIVVRDTGAGIAQANLSKIFDPYFTTRKDGSGLGLATSYSIIKNHDGYITVSSKEGKGTSFDIYLPAFTGTPSAKAEIVSEITKGSGRILIMDDEEIVRVLGIRILTRLGYTVEAFADSAQTVNRYRELLGGAEAFDAVILDLVIVGGPGGKETLAMLKEIDPNVKTIVSSGYSADPILARYKEYGFSAVLPKPYSVEEISSVLHGLLAKK